MTEKGFDGQKIRAVFIQVGTKGMPEGVTGEPLLPAKAFFMGMDMP